MEKKTYHKISVSDLAPHVHSFYPNENKTLKILNWMKGWIDNSLACGKIQPNDFLPSKADLACHIGVSEGTIQNVYRLLEDAGYIESKQRIGSYIKNKKLSIEKNKLTSKRELAIETIKEFLINNNYKAGDTLISISKLSKKTNFSKPTLQSALSYLVQAKILKKDKINYIVVNLSCGIKNIKSLTLVDKTAEKLTEYIQEECKTGDKLPAITILAKKFKVSSKTIFDAIKILEKKELLLPRRGNYGTIVINGKNENIMQDTEYCYEKIEVKIKNYIFENYQIGEKLPSIKEFAEKYQISGKTIKKALNNLAEEGYVTSQRGRFGGTFVTDIPQTSSEAYKWLAISEDFTIN